MSHPTAAERARRPRGALALLAVCGLVLTACPEEPPDVTERRLGVYGAMVEWIVDNRVPPAEVNDEGEPEGRLLFVEALGPEIDLQVQVELVARFEEDDIELRFIDNRSEALDEAEPDAPVRNGGVLVGLGPIPDGRQVEVRAEIYHRADDLEAHRFTLNRRGDEWRLVDEPIEVEPEGFVPAP